MRSGLWSERPFRATGRGSIASRVLPPDSLMSMSVSRLLALLGLAGLTLPAAGCCTMARLFCGPDDSRWISESYGSPTATLDTFQESLRRAERQVLLRCLSEECKARYGLDTVSIEIAWRQLNDAVTGIHLLGTAERGELESLGQDRVRVVLRVAGRSLRVTLGRHRSWELHWTAADGSAMEDGAYVDSLDPYLIASPEDAGTATRLAITLPPVDARLGAQDLRFAGLVVDWRVESFEVGGADQGDQSAPAPSKR